MAKDYTASTTATVISTAGDAALTVRPEHDRAGPPGQRRVHAAGGAEGHGDSPVGTPAAGRSGSPLSLLTTPARSATTPVTIGFTQHIGATDALRTGAYSKTLTFTLSTTTP